MGSYPSPGSRVRQRGCIGVFDPTTGHSTLRRACMRMGGWALGDRCQCKSWQWGERWQDGEVASVVGWQVVPHSWHSSLACWWVELAWLGSGSIHKGSRDGRATRRVCGLAALHIHRFRGPPWSCMRGNECVSRRCVSKRGFNISM